MQIMILNHNLTVQHLQHPAKRRRHGQMQSNSTMAPDLRKGNVLVADPPFVKAHGQAEGVVQREVGHHGDADHVEEFLLVVCVGGEGWVGVLGEVVRAVELPERVEVVHEAVVPVEPEVEDDAVDADFEWEPFPVKLGGELVRVVGEVGGHDDARDGGFVQGGDDLGHAYVWDAVTGLVAI